MRHSTRNIGALIAGGSALVLVMAMAPSALAADNLNTQGNQGDASKISSPKIPDVDVHGVHESKTREIDAAVDAFKAVRECQAMMATMTSSECQAMMATMTSSQCQAMMAGVMAVSEDLAEVA
jgi:valyl-tRNA synthetase